MKPGGERQDRPAPTLGAAVTADDLAAVRALFVEYQGSLGISLDFQGFGRELEELPGPYAAPSGRLLLARLGGEPVGCAALKGLAGGRCEMKRLYLRPQGRGLGLGRRMGVRLIEEAVAMGCREMVLDSLPTMVEAQRLYEDLGFRDIPAYRPNPVPGARFMGLPLPASR